MVKFPGSVDQTRRGVQYRLKSVLLASSKAGQHWATISPPWNDSLVISRRAVTTSDWTVGWLTDWLMLHIPHRAAGDRMMGVCVFESLGCLNVLKVWCVFGAQCCFLLWVNVWVLLLTRQKLKMEFRTWKADTCVSVVMLTLCVFYQASCFSLRVTENINFNRFNRDNMQYYRSVYKGRP